MYLDNENYKAKLGIVNVAPRGNSIRIRFFYPAGKAREFTVGSKTEDGFLKAVKIAQQINRDIELDQFDDTLASYSAKHAKAMAIANKPMNLLEVWENYKTYNKDRVAGTTIKNKWRSMENVLEKSNFLELADANNFVKEQLSYYSLSTLKMVWSNCLNPAVNFAIKQKKIKIENPYVLPSPQEVEEDIDCYEKDEIYAILEALKKNTYNSPFSAFKHDYYLHYTYFQSLTGMRPEEACALEWTDIFERNGRTYIRISKAYSKGVLIPHTKNRTVRLFPVNEQLANLLEAMKRNKNPKNKNNTLFCGIKGGYFHADNFNRNIWTKVVKGLMADKILDRYLVPYTLRHSFTTRLVRSGEMDLKTISAISGHSVEILVSRYLKTNQSIDIPEF